MRSDDLSEILIEDLHKILNAQVDVEQSLKHIPTQDLAFLLYNLGKIGPGLCAQLDADALSQVIWVLRRREDTTTRVSHFSKNTLN